MPGKSVADQVAMQEFKENEDDDEEEYEIYTVTNIDLENLPFTFEQIQNAVNECAHQIQEEILMTQQIQAQASAQLAQLNQM